jgi:hypothetical protein
MTKNEKLQDFQNILRNFLDIRKWDQDVEYLEQTEKWMVSTELKAQSHIARAFIEGSDATGVLPMYLYYSFSCKEAKQIEMLMLLNWINRHLLVGHFELTQRDQIRWVLEFDCEGLNMNGVSVSINFQHGWNVISGYSDAISAVALTKASAEEAMADFNEANGRQDS